MAAFILLLNVAKSYSQGNKIVKASGKIVDIRVGDKLRKGGWNLDASVRPDVYDAYVPMEGRFVTFITDIDSIQFNVKPGDYHSFVVLINGKDSAFTAIKGSLDLPRARFSDSYKKVHKGKTFVEIPQVYELMNVVIALTKEGKKDNGMAMKNTPYYADVLHWFDKFSNEPVVMEVNLALENSENYSAIKMDAYAFEFKDGHILQSTVYDRIGFSQTNNIAYMIPKLHEFAEKTRFSDFYTVHQAYYNGLIKNYRDSIGVPEMQKWLKINFPSTRYDSFKIIFSPLVAGNQSATWFDYDNFKEAQAHVNFPFRGKEQSESYSKEALLVVDGNIVFTELNHAFINPESEKPQYANRIQKAFENLGRWNDSQKPAKYYNDAFSSFNEYMNWALVCVRYIDYLPEKEQDKLIKKTENMMVNSRGFLKFAEFDQFVVALYKKRKKGQVVADLYPEIISWFENNKT
ncbi:DUF4932 domain-containing protein [Dyadobacter sp. 3J3]|uniref:DUF4932 domain-containing protein n=1 Tax=Dyadobacter sp. 3J3 TaxID=2606600 RepID=UPI001E47564E|nr:DUF4932 domain-containing protein [Dyadobacter sp. 3J3]